MKTKLSLHEARNIAVASQRLNLEPGNNQSQSKVIDIIRQLGYLQIDTISVVARTHEHTLWVRTPDFSTELLYAAQRDDCSIFEYWAHAMSFIPIEHYRYFLPVMKLFHNHENSRAKPRYEKYGHLVDEIYQRVKTDGPMKSRDFAIEIPGQAKTWWDWRPEKIVLELLLWRGDLMVRERQGFQKVYDITERVLPDWVNTDYPVDEEIGCYVVEQALIAYGVASEKNIFGFYHEIAMHTIKQGLQLLLESGKIREVELETHNDQRYYVLSNALEFPVIDQKAVSILSPFDNLIIQRDRLAQLFEFNYSLECYLPAGKRVYGYYVMPILYGAKLVGRLDPKADRKTKILYLRAIYFEEGFHPDEIFFTHLAKKLAAMMDFNGCESLVLEKLQPQKYRTGLLSALSALHIEFQEIQ
jgi:uncharacterized protein YcaQ